MTYHERRIEAAKQWYIEEKIDKETLERIIENALNEEGPYYGRWILSQVEAFRAPSGTLMFFGKKYEQREDGFFYECEDLHTRGTISEV